MDIYDIILKQYNNNKNRFADTKYIYLLISRLFNRLEKEKDHLLLQNSLILILGLLEIELTDIVHDIGKNLTNLSESNKKIYLNLLKSELDGN